MIIIWRVDEPVTETLKLTDNDDDFDEDNIPGFSHPSLAAQLPLPDKGKSRAPPEQLAPPSGTGGAPQSPTVSGNIGTSSSGSQRGARKTFGGVQVETRYDVMNCVPLDVID